jgi:hypothetical protein
MRALISLATGLADTDRVLRQQLNEIGVSWQGQAGDGGAQATQTAAVYANAAVTPVSDSAAGVASQSGSFSHTRDSAPDAGALRGPTQLNGFDRFAGAFGHTTDHAKDVKNTNAAREAAVAGMTGYQSNSTEALGRAQTLPVPPGMDLVTRPAGVGTSVSNVGGPNPSGGPFVPGTATQLPGGGPPGIQTTGPGPVGPFSGPPGVPGQPGMPNIGPGPNSGIGPVPPLPAPAPTTTGGPPLRGVPPIAAAEAAALALAGGAGAQLGAAAEKDRVVRGKPGGAVPVTPGEPGKGGAPAPKAPGVAIGAVAEEDARSVRNAERFGAKPGKPAATPLMAPAASARDEEDTEHVRKYGVDSTDVFEDGRMISPALIGDEDED